MTPIPETFTIAGQLYRLERRPPDDPVLVSPRADLERLGTIVVAQQRLLVADDLGPDIERDTVLHELLHICLKLMGGPMAPSAEERVVGLIAPTLLDTLRRNPDLAAYLLDR